MAHGARLHHLGAACTPNTSTNWQEIPSAVLETRSKQASLRTIETMKKNTFPLIIIVFLAII